METQYVRYFVSVAKHLNFQRAAEECRVSQPALSVQIRKLEEELGCQLFYRSKRQVQLTPDGNQLLPKMQGILSQMQAVKMQAAGFSNPFVGEIRIGLSSLIGNSGAFVALRRLRQKHPSLSFSFEEGESRRLPDRLKNAEFDLVLHTSVPQVTRDDFHYRVFQRDPLVKITPTVGEQDQSQLKFINVNPQCPCHAIIEKAARAMGKNVDSCFVAAEVDMIRRVVSAGGGWSIIPESVLSKGDDKILQIEKIPGAFIEYVIGGNSGKRTERLIEGFLAEL